LTFLRKIKTPKTPSHKGWGAEILREQLPGGYWHNYAILNRPKYVSSYWKFFVLADLGVTAENEKWVLDRVHPDLQSAKVSGYSFSLAYEPFPAIPFALEKAGRPSKMITLRAMKVLKAVES
jgi:hypothetical protein